MILVDPKWPFDTLVEQDILDTNILYINFVSYEDRCIDSVSKCFGMCKTMSVAIIDIQDDDCSYPPWREECSIKTGLNWRKIQDLANIHNVELPERPFEFKMSKRAEDALRLRLEIKEMVSKAASAEGTVRCVLDMTCSPSYFGFQLLKDVIKYDQITDVIVLYTKPQTYPETLKTSPPDKAPPNFLPSFGTINGKVKWIVGIGFDYDSVKNAEKIKETLDVEKIDVIIPFPAYKPEYVVRTMKENQVLISNNAFWYAPADNPFKTFEVIKSIVGTSDRYILSSFGPKPMALGFAMAAIKLGIPIVHVQATNYNPIFSEGSVETMAYCLKYNGALWWDRAAP